MGLFNRLFGAPTPKTPPAPPAAAKRPPQKPPEKAAEKPPAATTAPAKRAEETAVTAAVETKAVEAAATPETHGEEAVAPATIEATIEVSAEEAAEAMTAPEATAPTETPEEAEAAADIASPAVEAVSADAIDLADAADTADMADTHTETAAAVQSTPEPVAEASVSPAENAADETDAPAAAAPEISEHLQKRLDTYFARLRQDFPDGRITRLNTAHKKLAERGAELRRLIGYEGRLDEFFALGGFTYQRGVSGRPALPVEQTASVEDRLRQQFPEDVPTLLAVQQADHRLYLDLRAAARRAGCTVGEYLDQFRAG